MTPYTHGGDVLTARARFGGDVLDCSALRNEPSQNILPQGKYGN